MSTAVRLRSKLPDGDLNGLALLGAKLRTDPGTMVLLALVSPVAVTENLETGDEVLSLGIEHVELTGDIEARNLLRWLYGERTGVTELPFDLRDGAGVITSDIVVEVVGAELVKAAKAAGIDVTTGEVTTDGKPRRQRKAAAK